MHSTYIYILVYCSHAHPQLGTTTMQTTYSVNIFLFSTLIVCTTMTFQQIRDLCVLDQGDLSFFIFFPSSDQGFVYKSAKHKVF